MMKFLVLLGIGVLLIGRALYVLMQIGKGAEKFKAQSKSAYILMIIGVLCVAITPAWFLFFNEHEEKSPQKAVQQIQWSIGQETVNNYDVEKLKRLLGIFQAQCNGWQQYPQTIESAVVSIRKFKKSNYDLFAQEQLGWYTEVELDIKIKDNAKFPTELRMIPGHTLHYFIGGGKEPGILMIKDVSALFLGIPESSINPSTHTFVANEAYRIADELVIDE